MKYVFQDQIRNKKQKMILWCFKENYSSRRFYEKMGGKVINYDEIEFENKNYGLAIYEYDISNLKEY